MFALLAPDGAPPAGAVQPPGLRYSIQVQLDPERHRLTGSASIVYRSGADTSLTRLYLHAYPNAFSSAKTTYARERERQGEDFELRFAPREDLGWMAIDSAAVNGTPAVVEMRETIASIGLPRPLQPLDSVRLFLRFRVQVPTPFDRFGRTGDAYAVAQWYPKLAVYDDEGWHADPYHYLAEFYGDYGDFDVAITLPDGYWVGATGTFIGASGGDNEIPLQERDIPGDSVTVRIRASTADTLAGRWPAHALRIETDLHHPGAEEGLALEIPRGEEASLRIPRGAPVHYAYQWADGSHREDDPREEADAAGAARPLRLLLASADTTVVDTLRALAPVPRTEPPDTLLPSMKTLRFRAERVHDFAWVASPDYVRGDTTWSGIHVRALSFRDDQEKWALAKRYAVDALRHHAERVGPYVYPALTTAEAHCGCGAMEYPMLIMSEPELVETQSHDLDDTMAHEVGHQWFYGMLGSDEHAHPWLDEGFTQWLEDEYTDGKYPRGYSKHQARFPWLTPKSAFTWDEMRYLARAWARDERPMSTPAERFASVRDYSVGAYNKPVGMLRALRSVIGDSAYASFLRRYYQENLYRHPRPQDVVRAAERASGKSLDAFFDTWTRTIQRAGFAVGRVRRERSGSGLWRSSIEVRRTESMAIPVTVQARFADGSRQEKQVPLATPTQTAVFESAARLTDVRLDPRKEIWEMDRLDNGTGLLPPMRFRPLFDFPQSDEVAVLYGPTVWHGRAEGARLGAWMEGRYLPTPDFPRGVRGFEAGVNLGTRAGAVAWRGGAWRRAGALGARAELRGLTARDAGLLRLGARIGNWITAPGRLHPWRTWWAGLQYRDRDEMAPVDARYWSSGRTINGSAGFLVETVGPGREDRVELEYRRGASAFRERGDPAPDAQYDWARLDARSALRLPGGAFQLRARGFLGSAWHRPPRELRFDVAEASRLDALARFYENDRGPLRATGRYLAEGGGGMRGYAGRAALANRMASVNLELSHAATGAFLFGDVGRGEASGAGEPSRAPDHPLLGRTLADAGLGYAYKGLRLVFPVWVGSPPSSESPWKARWRFSLDLAGIHPWW